MRVLIGWEIGGGMGHVERIRRHRSALEADGHEVVVAMKRLHPDIPDALEGPRWPGGPSVPRPGTLGDVLHSMGLGVPGTLAMMVDRWRSILDDVRPDAVVADFAPALVVAARGRARTILIGNGYDCPPSDMDAFPVLFGERRVDEAAMRAAVGGPVPTIFGADHVVVGSLPELDPHAALRPGAHVMPRAAAAPSDGGDEVFVYWQGPAPAGLPQVLDACGLPLRSYRPGSPTPWPEIAGRSRIVLSHGGAGFVTQALLSGTPQIVVASDLEKIGYARAVEAMDAGIGLLPTTYTPAMLAEAISTLYHDDAARTRTMRESQRLAGHVCQDPADAVCAILKPQAENLCKSKIAILKTSVNP